jgi:predicted kinase
MSSNADSLIACLVGFPGVGKLTIAKALAPKFGAKIVDNHWINEPILRLVTDDSSKAVPEAIWSQVAKGREAVLDTISTRAPARASFIFAYAGADEDLKDHKAFEEYRNVAVRRGARFVAVRLLCGEEELSRRIQSAERVRRKLVDPVDAITNVRNYTLLDPRVPDTLTLDTTNLSPEAAATAILAHINAGRSG